MAGRLAGLSVAALLAAAAMLLTAGTAAGRPLDLDVELGGDAALGSSTSLTFRLKMADGQEPVDQVRILTPAGVDLSTSELGMATCERPQSELNEVMTVIRHFPCPHNALMGTGRATAQLRLADLFYTGAARLSLYAGEPVDDRPGLIVIAEAYRPIRTMLTYSGYLYVPPPQFGVGIALNVRQPTPLLFGAPLALSSFKLLVGAAALRYTRTSGEQRVKYRPRAIPLPDVCPAKGLRFRAIVHLSNGARLSDDALVRCPSRRVRR